MKFSKIVRAKILPHLLSFTQAAIAMLMTSSISGFTGSNNALLTKMAIQAVMSHFSTAFTCNDNGKYKNALMFVYVFACRYY